MVSSDRFKPLRLALPIAVLIALTLEAGFAQTPDVERAQKAQEAELVKQADRYISRVQGGTSSVEELAGAVRELDDIYQRMRAIIRSQGQEKWDQRTEYDEFKRMHDFLPLFRAQLVEALTAELKAARLKPNEVRARLAELLTARAEGGQAEAQTEVQTPAVFRPWDVAPSRRPPATDDQRLRQMIEELNGQTDWHQNELNEMRRNAGLYFRTVLPSIVVDYTYYDEQMIWLMAGGFAEESGAETRAWMDQELSTSRRLEEDWAWLHDILDKSFEDLQKQYFDAQDSLRAHLLIRQETWSAEEALAYPATIGRLCGDLVSAEQMLVWYLGAPSFEESERRARSRAEQRERLEQQQPVVLRQWLKWQFLKKRDESLPAIVSPWDAAKKREKMYLTDAPPDQPNRLEQAEADYSAAKGALDVMKLELMRGYFGWRIKDGLQRAIEMPKFRPRLKQAGHDVNFYRNLLLRAPPADVDEYERLKDLGFFKNCQSRETYHELLTGTERAAHSAQDDRRRAALAAGR